MAQFEAFEKGVEVNGQTVLSVVEGMEHFKDKAIKILAQNGIPDPKVDEWFSQQSWLDAFKDIAENVGPHALYSIGAKIPENAQFPPNIDSLEKALESIDIAYHMNHRGGEIGSYKFEKLPDGTLRFVCNNPYPCEFDRGIIEGIARRFVPDGHHLIVKHDDTLSCRDKGDESCTYFLEIS